MIFLAAAVAGVFGGGPISQSELSALQGKVIVTYAKTLRRQTPQFLQVEFRGPGRQEIAISDELMRAWSIQKVVPMPEKVIAGHQYTVYRFYGDQDGRIVFQYKAERIGTVSGILRVADETTLKLNQWVFP